MRVPTILSSGPVVSLFIGNTPVIGTYAALFQQVRSINISGSSRDRTSGMGPTREAFRDILEQTTIHNGVSDILTWQRHEFMCLRIDYSGEILSDGMRGLMIPNNDQWRRWRKVFAKQHSRQSIGINHS